MLDFPIWLLYFFPFFLPVNYLIKFGLIFLVLYWSGKQLDMPRLLTRKRVIRSLVVTICAELLGVGTFFLSEINLSLKEYYGNYFTFSLFAFLVTVAANFALNYFFALKKTDLDNKQKLIVSALLCVATAPYLFFLPG